MADEKTFSESEHIAILADRVSKETSDLTVQLDQLTKDKTELENKLDVAESAKTAAEQKAETAEKALTDYKASVEEQREAAARKDDRIKQVRESAEHLDDAFFDDEARVARIVAMKDEDFQGYLADIKATAAKTAPATTTAQAPRETAMAGATPTTQNGSAARDFLLSQYLPVKGD
jgi:chromosome segregation ATPase